MLSRSRPTLSSSLRAGLALALAAGVMTASHPAEAAGPVENRDFAAEVLGDAWDFSNAEDLPLVDGPPVSMNVSGGRLVDGTFEWTSDGGFLDLHPMTVPGALPDSRDGRWNPVDADTYTHVSLRLHASTARPFRVGWFTCADDYTPCFAFHDFWVDAGWNTVTLPMRQLDPAWRGDLLGIRLASGGGETTFRLDWLRIHTAGAPAAPPTGAPHPRILTPDAAGDEDAAAVVRGDAWDFSQPSDVIGMANVGGVAFRDGQLHATNAGPVQNDPWIQLPVGAGIDPERHHLLTVTTTYDGPFSLADAPGGGAHGRLLFRRAGLGPAWIDGRELVTFPSRPTATYDLRDGRFGSTVEPGQSSWTGSTVTALRWDPNEDRGARSWRVDEIRLAAPHESQGLFTVEWTDPAHVDGTRVDVGVSRTRGDAEGTPVATGVRQRAGTNRVTVDLTGARPGPVWVWVRATSPSGVTTTTTANGVLEVTGRVAGPTRVATGLALSQVGWRDGASSVVLASARGFPDALAGVQLADAVDGPLLLVEPGSLGEDVAAELRRLRPDEVLVLGGTAAVAPQVLDAVVDVLPDAAVRRVSGEDRYETSAAIAELATQRWRAAGRHVADEVVLASGTAFPDALAAGPLVAATQRPLLLTAPDHLPEATREALASRPRADVLVVGGEVAVAERVVDATGRQARRIAGRDRWETAGRLADAAVAAGASTARPLLASGEDFPDALGAGALAAHRGDVLLLVARGAVPSATRDRLVGPAVQRTLVVGGRAAVAQEVVDQAHALARG